ncbi:MAG: TonB-dependent receptor [Phascolarctobacterium sp.]|nr:TonB-dependent receptor [Phascolarctobacterium sp.]
MKKENVLRNAILLSLLVGATAVYSPVVMAAEENAAKDGAMEFAMDEYVVTASRTQTAKVDTPANVATIDAAKIESRRYQDVAEALKDVPGVSVMDTGSGAYEKAVIINGDSRVLIMVDGRKLNIASGTSSGRASFDMNLLPDVNNIDKIEIVKGSGGALYGSDAVGGVVNIITKKASHSYGKASMAFGSSQSRDAKLAYSAKEGKTGVSISASKTKQGYYKYKDIADHSTKRWPEVSDYTNEKISFKINQDITEASSLEFGVDYAKCDGHSATSLTNYAWNGTSYSSRKLTNIFAKYNWTLNESNEGYIQVYHNEYNYLSRQIHTNQLYGDIDIKTNGVDVQQNIIINDNNKLVVGASWNKDDVDDVADHWLLGPLGYHYNTSITNKALFLNDTWEFTPSWTLNTGVRYDNHSEAGDKTTLSAGLNKRIDENSHAYINWGQVFKAPNATELFDPDMGNRNLKPEKGDTWNVGYGTKINDKTEISLNYFQSNIDDAIAYPPPSYVATNYAKQKSKGMEISVTHELNDNWDLEASYTYVRVRNDKNDGNGFVRDANYAPNAYRVGVRYHDEKWNANLMMRAASGADNKAFIDSSYVTFDMLASYKATKAWTVFAKGYNLFNKAYTERAGIIGNTYDYPAQSRRFIVGAEYSF